MAKQPYVSFAEIKAKVSLLELFEHFGIRDTLKGKGHKLHSVCPLPTHVHGPSPNPEQFRVTLRDGVWVWYCHGDCGRGGDVIEFAKAMTGYDDAHIRLWFAATWGSRLDLTKPRETADPPAAKKEKSRDGTGWTSDSSRPTIMRIPENVATPPAECKPLRYQLELEADHPYLLNERGFSAATIQRFGLGYCRPRPGRRRYFDGYACIPIHRHPRQTAAERPVGYLGRWAGSDFDADAGRPRYKWPEGFPASHFIYGLELALADSADTDPLIVVEGPLKTAYLFQCGLPNTVSTFTAAVSDEQADLLVATGRPITLCFDGNEAGRSGMRKAAATLITRTFVRVVRLDDGVEPDDLTADKLRHLVS